MPHPSVAIVILNWNGRHYLEKFLPSVLSSTYINKRVIVADNASSDDSVSFLRNHYPQVELLHNATNEGFAKGYNTALKQVESDYYVLLNSDVEVTADWIEPIIELMELDKLIAACQPKIRSYVDKDMFEYAGASGGWMDVFGYPFNRGRIFEFCEEDTGQYDNPMACFWASGAAFFVRADVFHQTGGFDPYFFAHQEEIDLCWRMQRAGYKVFVQPRSVVYHVGGGTLPKGNSLKTFLNFRNNLIMIRKNTRTSTAMWKLPLRMVLDIAAAFRAICKGDGGYAVAIVKAHWQFLCWLFKRKNNKHKINTFRTDLDGYFTDSIVWHYFIRNKKTFSEIINGK